MNQLYVSKKDESARMFNSDFMEFFSHVHPATPLVVLLFGNAAPAAWAGLAAGYVCYDSIHYAIHHFPMKAGLLNRLKQHHLRHHYHDDHSGYGVSSPFWDYVFRTNRK